MQILIDIPDEQIEKCLEESKYIHENEGEKGSVNIVLLYTNKKLEFVDISRKTDFYSLTDKYTVLPKGHGRLIDADEYKEHLYACETNGRPLHIMELDERLATVDDVPTIIEADKAESEDKSCSNCKYWLLDVNKENRRCKICVEMDEWVAESEVSE